MSSWFGETDITEPDPALLNDFMVTPVDNFNKVQGTPSVNYSIFAVTQYRNGVPPLDPRLEKQYDEVSPGKKPFVVWYYMRPKTTPRGETVVRLVDTPMKHQFTKIKNPSSLPVIARVYESGEQFMTRFQDPGSAYETLLDCAATYNPSVLNSAPHIFDTGRPKTQDIVLQCSMPERDQIMWERLAESIHYTNRENGRVIKPEGTSPRIPRPCYHKTQKRGNRSIWFATEGEKTIMCAFAQHTGADGQNRVYRLVDGAVPSDGQWPAQWTISP